MTVVGPSGPVKLRPYLRGGTFAFEFYLLNDWHEASFTGGMLWVARRYLPLETVPDDSDAGVLARISTDDGVTFDDVDDDTHGRVEVSYLVARLWPAAEYHWSLFGFVTGLGQAFPVVYGTFEVVAAPMRSTAV